MHRSLNALRCAAQEMAFQTEAQRNLCMAEKQCQRGEIAILKRDDLINVLIVIILTEKSWSLVEGRNIVRESSHQQYLKKNQNRERFLIRITHRTFTFRSTI